MSTRIRRLVLFAALAGTLGLVIFEFIRDERAASVPTRPAADARSAHTKGLGPSPSGTGGNPGLLTLPERSPLGGSRTGLFSSHSWQPPALKSTAVLPSAPTAPSMPYRYAGKLVQGGQHSVLLADGDRVFPIKEGDTLDGAYRVEAIGESQITLMYLPLKHKESIPVFSSLLPAGGAASGASSAAAEGKAPVPSSIAAVTQGTASAETIQAPAPPAGGPAPSAAQTAESGPARLLWAGPQHVKLGARFEVALKVTSGQPLQAAPMQLRFDPSQLEFVTARPGKFFGGGDRDFSYRAGPDGSIFVGASSQKAAAAADAELLILTFRPVKAAPAAELSVSSLNLQGAAGRPIAFGPPEAFKTAISP
jgi:hypothetical protein